MKKRQIINLFVIILLFSFQLVLADSIDSEIKKLAHYAEEYETGNIDYIKLTLYSASIREKINEILGATEKHEGGILEQEQIKKALGEPIQETKWAWVEKQERERRLLTPVPVWEKIIFDGKKIQIKLRADPSIFIKKRFFEDEDFEEKEENSADWEEEKLVYRLHFDIQFKRPQEQLNIEPKINEIKELAVKFNSDPSQENAEALAKQSVNTEKSFESFFRQTSGNCEESMNQLFGSENQRQEQKLLVQEINFFEGENFDAIVRLEMCDECEWNWINLDLRLEGRGPGFKHPEPPKEPPSQLYENKELSSFKNEVKEVLDGIKNSLENEDFEGAFSYKNKLWMLNEAWNRKSNDVWEEINKKFDQKRESMSGEDRRKYEENFGWIKDEQEKRKIIDELRKKNYEERKRFYSEYFSGYYRSESYYEQKEWEKRLIEEFLEKGKEICDNNADDNKNEKIDCEDEQCGGKICGKEKIIVGEGDETSEKDIELYCIMSKCQKREEIIERKEPVCGNHICEEGEMINEGAVELKENEKEKVKQEGNTIQTENITDVQQNDEEKKEILNKNYYCPKDCVKCPVHESIDCPDGKIIFKGKDKNNCPLEPVCIKESNFCKSDEDCVKPLCGEVSCVKGFGEEVGACQTTALELCREAECTSGDKKIKKCESGEEIVVELCNNDGLWQKTGVDCVEKPKEEKSCNEYCISQPHIMCVGEWKISGTYPNCNCEFICGEPIVGKECETKEDCGSVNDVCSNGKCVSIPEKNEEIEKKECESNEQCDDGNECTEDYCVDKKCGRIDKCLEKESEEIKEIKEEIKEEEGEEKISEEKKEEVEERTEESSKQKQKEEQRESEIIQESKSESQLEKPSSEPLAEPQLTGNIIFRFLRILIGIPKITGITGNVITGFQVEEGGEVVIPVEGSEEQIVEPPRDEQVIEPPHDEQRSEEEMRGDERRNLEEDEQRRHEGDERRERDRGEERERDRKDEREQRCKEDCNKRCTQEIISMCVNDCVFVERSEKMKELEECKTKCNEEKKGEVEKCADDCYNGCLKDNWEDFEKQMEKKREAEEQKHRPEKGVFKVGGTCRKAKGKTEAFIFFDGWGEPFNRIQPLKSKYYQGGEMDWCKWEVENRIMQRKEFEKGFNQEFATWFFEKYLSNSAEDWEQHVSGIFELYWRNVDMQRELAFRIKECYNDKKEIYQPNLISFSYSTDYGSIEFWEEIKEANLPGMKEKLTIVSPYMKIWIYPTKEFIKYEMKSSMKAHEFPGPPEEKMKIKNEGFPPEELKKFIREDKKFMKKIEKISEKYGGDVRAVLQIKDFEKDEVLYNILAIINKEEIMEVKPMLPEEVKEYDIKVEINFEDLYDMIMFEEKNMRGVQIESPPWDRKKIRPVQKIKDFTNGIRMYFKAKKIVNNAKVTPESESSEVKNFILELMKMSGKAEESEHREGPPEGFEDLTEEEKKELMKDMEENGFDKGFSKQESEAESFDETWKPKEIITGEVVFR